MEGDLTEEERKARQALRAGDKTRYRNITIPVIMPQVQAAVGYLSQVFLFWESNLPCCCFSFL